MHRKNGRLDVDELQATLSTNVLSVSIFDVGSYPKWSSIQSHKQLTVTYFLASQHVIQASKTPQCQMSDLLACNKLRQRLAWFYTYHLWHLPIWNVLTDNDALVRGVSWSDVANILHETYLVLWVSDKSCIDRAKLGNVVLQNRTDGRQGLLVNN